MASNSFGELFRMTTWGESHGRAIGVVIDGCPSGIFLNEKIINDELKKRAPGLNPYTSPRKEADRCEILSGVFDKVTTGTPISILIWNQDADTTKYEPIKDVLRPGHANYGYLEKYGVFDYRGGGRASARETASRVAAGAVAKQFLKQFKIEIIAYVKQVSNIVIESIPQDFSALKKVKDQSPIFCPDLKREKEIFDLVLKTKESGDSLGGVVEFQIRGTPAGLGDPVYQKLDACLASAMMGIPAVKGFEMGEGFAAVLMNGSEHNDLFALEKGNVITETNHSGGILGGISSGMNVIGRVAFKPTSSIMKKQQSLNTKGEVEALYLPKGSRHDPCVALRAPAIVEAMAAVVVADALLLNRSAKL